MLGRGIGQSTMPLRVTERFLHLPRTVVEDQMQSCDWEEDAVLWPHFCFSDLSCLPSCLVNV
jgi:hypothetical protein